MKTLALILVYLTLSCRGFNQGRQIEDLKFSAYRWRYNSNESARYFYLDWYIEIKSNGKFELMRHDKTRKAIYYKGLIKDTVLEFIDSTLFNNKFRIEYLSALNCLSPYNGLTYLLDYKVGKKRKTIQFGSPICIPHKLNAMKILLDSIVINTNQIRIKKINLNRYIKYLKKISYPFLPPIPKAPPKDDKKNKFSASGFEG